MSGGLPGPAKPPLRGHSEAAHQLLGWCAHCEGRTEAQEATAWRGWAATLLHTISEGVCGSG
ncbi:hypothetical protein ABT352_22670 [Streptosporangium sp. NPDC000563]|uniref:hypothetical protein n=1 Tax=Streptosporangium sp. NPDC000563 TaxID=3154366 RepID=UPI00331B2C15